MTPPVCRACGRPRELVDLVLVTGSGERFFVCRPSDTNVAPGRYVTCFRQEVGNVRRHAIEPACVPTQIAAN